MNKPFDLTEQERHGIERWLSLTDSQKRRDCPFHDPNLPIIIPYKPKQCSTVCPFMFPNAKNGCPCAFHVLPEVIRIAKMTLEIYSVSVPAPVKTNPFCPYCGGTNTRECEAYDFQPIDEGGGTLTLVGYRCAKGCKSFWI